MFNCSKNCRLFSEVLAPFYVPTCSFESSGFSKSSHLLFNFLIVDILVGMKRYFLMVPVCISLMTNEVQHLFVCLLAICNIPWVNVSSDCLLIFSLDCLFIIELYKIFISPWLVGWFASIFSHCAGFLLTFLITSEAQKF